MDKLFKILRLILVTLMAARAGLQLGRDIREAAGEAVEELVDTDDATYQGLVDDALERWGRSGRERNERFRSDLDTAGRTAADIRDTVETFTREWPKVVERLRAFTEQPGFASFRAAAQATEAPTRDMSPEAVAERRQDGDD